MVRDVGGIEPIQELIPEELALGFGLLTQLGDVWFLTLLVVLVYWSGRHRRDAAAVVGGLTLAGLALIDGLKNVFALPRPDEPLVAIESLPWVIQPLYEATATAGGYGFPSGHALMTTIVYFQLAETLSVGTRRRRYATASALVATVSFTRIVLGVHYPADVLAGVLVGLAFLVVARRLLPLATRDRATVAFALAVAFCSANLLASGPDGKALLLLAASLGALGGWQLVALGSDLVSLDRPEALRRAVALRGSIAVVALGSIALVVEEFSLGTTVGRAGAVGLVTALVVTAPVVRHSERLQGFRAGLAFWTRSAVRSLRPLARRETWRRAAAAATVAVARLRRWLIHRSRDLRSEGEEHPEH